MLCCAVLCCGVVQPVLSLYIVVEIIITAVSAMEALRPLLLYRFLVIIFAYEVRYGALLVRPHPYACTHCALYCTLGAMHHVSSSSPMKSATAHSWCAHP